MELSLFQFALIFVIVLLIYQVIIQTLIYLRQKKKSTSSSFGAITSTALSVVLPNDKNVLYMVIQNPYVTTTLDDTSTVEKIDEFYETVTDLQKFKRDLITDIYSVDNFIKSVLINYNYTFDKSVTTLVDFSKESLIKTFELTKKKWAVCANTTYKDVINYLFTDSVMLQSYMNSIRKKNIVLDGQANNPVITANTFQDVTTPNWGRIVLLNGTNGFSPVIPYASGAVQAFSFQKVRTISQSVKLSAKSYALSTFCSSRKNDATRGDLPMYVYNDTSNSAQVVKSNPIEVALSLTESTTKEETIISTSTSAPTTTQTVEKINLQTTKTTTVSVSNTATKKTTVTTTVTRSIIGVIIPKTSLTWQQDLLVFDIPKEGTYVLSFTSTWSADDRTSFLTDIILSDVTPFDFLPTEYKCKKPTLNTQLQYIKSTREDDVKNILSFYSITEKMSVTGNDLSTTTGATVTQCKSLCDVNSACGGFIFDNTTNTCSLKTGVVTPTPVKNDKTTLYRKVEKSTYSQVANNNVVGNDLFTTVNTATDVTDINKCTNACDITPDCKGFAYEKSTKKCFLKSDVSKTTTSTTTDVYTKGKSKFTNARTGSFGNVKEKFGVVTNWTDKPVNPYLNSYVIFSDNSYGFVMADGKVRRFGDKNRIVREIQGKNGCPMLESPNYYTWHNDRWANSFKKLPYSSLSSAPIFDPPLVEGPPLNNGDSCFVDGTKITYTNNYAAPIKDLNHIEFDVGTASGTVKTVDQCKAECNKTTGCVGFIYETATKKCHPKSYLNLPRSLLWWKTSNGNVIKEEKGFDMYRRQALDQNGKDVTNATEVNPFLNKMLFQSGISSYYVHPDGTYYVKQNYEGNGTCPWGRQLDEDGNVGTVKWMAKESDYSKLQFYSPPLVYDSKVTLYEKDKCAIRGKVNPFLKQYIRYKSGTMYYVTDDGSMRKVPTWYVLDSISGKNGCPLSTDYVQLDTDDYNSINFTYQFKPPLKLGTDLVFGDYCTIPTTNPYLGKIIQYTDGTYFYITTLGLVRNIPTTDILYSIVGKNGCPLTTAIQKVNTNDYNTLGVFTPPLLPGTEMTFNDYCTGFTPVLTDVSKLQLTTATGPNYPSLYFDNAVKSNEVYIVLNGQTLKLQSTMTSEQRKSALYDFITKNYF